MNDTIKNTPKPSKSFMTAGPTLHYSHPHIYRQWWLTIIVYAAVCIFWSKIITGNVSSISLNIETVKGLWQLGKYVVYPISIYEYPLHIFVLGTLMGLLAVIPLLMAQLLSSRYSVIFIIMVVLIAKLPGLAIFLAISCVGIASRPLRFRSRFISMILCTAPLIVYWSIYGGTKSVDPVIWGFSFSPWIFAWLIVLAVSGTVIGIGHFTRYKPGVTWLVSLLLLLVSIGVFNIGIGFSEADYQIYVAHNNPFKIAEFHSKTLTPILDKVVKDPVLRNYLNASFYSDEPILLREQLKREMQEMLRWNRWSDWFSGALTDKFMYEKKRKQLLASYDKFIEKHPHSKRIPIALYYKGILREMSPDIRLIGTQERLRFYSDYPKQEVRPTWIKLYTDFPNSPESIEARWRFAMYLAGESEFETAHAMCKEALEMLKYVEKDLNNQVVPSRRKIFTKPKDTALTSLSAKRLERRLRKLIGLIDGTNHIENDPQTCKRLAKFIMLNPHSIDYKQQLEKLLGETTPHEPLRENILLALAKLIEDPILRMKSLEDIISNYPNTDGCISAKFDLGLLKVKLWQAKDTSEKDKQIYLKDARDIFEDILSKHPDSIYTDQITTILDGLPKAK